MTAEQCKRTADILSSYVDSQLRHSRRFDADGIEQDYPELFVPSPRRRSSSSNSLSSASFNPTSKDEYLIKDQGQLRYWTSEMCSRSPHLFDFVITVSGKTALIIICLHTYCFSARRRWHCSLHVMAISTHRTPSPLICLGFPWFPDQLRFR